MLMPIPLRKFLRRLGPGHDVRTISLAFANGCVDWVVCLVRSCVRWLLGSLLGCLVGCLQPEVDMLWKKLKQECHLPGVWWIGWFMVTA